jgi:quercetin dioxygenase-like cupin family protein
MIDDFSNDETVEYPPVDHYFVPAGGGKHRQLFPGVEIRATAGDRLMISLVNFEPGSVVPDHSHPHEQMGIMISGQAEFTVGGATRILGPGDIWRIPGNVVHRVKAVGDAPAVALDVFHPVREDYL